MPKTRLRLVPVLLAATALCACEVGPNYHRPTAPTPATGAYKEIQGWTPAHPSDAADRADWWTVFNDPVLNDLEQKVATSNQSLASAEAAYQAARALVAEQRAALWPTIAATGAANVSHGPSTAVVGSNGVSIGAGRGTQQQYSLQLGGTWEPDIWGKVRRGIENAKGNAQSSYADIVNTRLSSQMELAVDYITLRQLDEEKRLDDDTVKAYTESLTVTRNKYNAGNAALSDVDAAETQLHNAKAADIALAQTRAQNEHAIAILTGQTPADLTLAPAAWTLQPVDVPPGVPSTLLQRRPDIAAAERLAAAASANIGVATAGYYPDITLTGAGGTEAAAIGQLFNPSTFFWNAGISAAETLFNGGLTHAQVQNARATYNEAVANYRQAVLTAFGQVEDNLAAQRVLAEEQPELKGAVLSADQDLRIVLNQYRAGTVDYTTVVVAQTQDYSARNAELQIEASRLTTTVDLVVALGGGWNADELKGK